MKRFRWLFLPPAVAGMVFLWIHDRASALRYNGRSLATWFDELNGDGPATNGAKAAIIAIGSNAVPFLVTQLTNGPAFGQQYLRFKEKLPSRFRQQLPAVPWVTRVHWNRRERAADMLGELGPLAKAAFPALVNLLSYVDWIEATPPSQTKSWISNPRLRMAALVAMEEIDADDPRVLQAIITLLKERASPRHLQSKQAVGAFGPAKNPSDKPILALRVWEYTSGDFLTVPSLVANGWTLVGFPSFDTSDGGTISVLKRRAK